MADSYETQEKKRASCNLYFGEKAPVQPKGIVDLNLKDDVTVIVKGRLTSLSLPDPSSYERGTRMEMIMTSCKIVGPEQKVTLEDAIKAAKKTV